MRPKKRCHPLIQPAGYNLSMKKDCSLDFDAIRRDASAAAEDFLTHRWDAYLDAVRRVEALPENQSGSDKTWVDRARAKYHARYRHAVRVES